MKKILPIIIFMSFYFSGCASIYSRQDASCRRGYYEGVKGDIDSMQHPSGFMNIAPSPVVIIVSLIDLPFSFILDTICLPYDLSHQCKNISENNEAIEPSCLGDTKNLTNPATTTNSKQGMANPSSVYAVDQGYPLKTVYSPAGESNAEFANNQ